MKNNNACPKCGSTEIICAPDSSYTNIQSGFTIFSAAKVSRYVCASCGFIELWVQSQEDIDKLVEKLKK